MTPITSQFTRWLILPMLLMPSSLVAAPANDNLAAAMMIEQLPYTQQQDTSAASNELGEVFPQCLNEVGASVWYQYTPNRNQSVVFDTFGSDYDTVLSVWNGTTHPLTQLACNDDHSNTAQSQVSLQLAKNTPYYINVSGFDGETGSLILNALTLNPLSNDHLADAMVIIPETNGAYSHTQTTQGATLQSQEVITSCARSSVQSSVWYQYTPPLDQRVVFNTLGSDYNTLLSVWTGDQHPLTEIACNDDSTGTLSQIGVVLTGGTNYFIKVATGETGSGSLFEPQGILVFNMTAPPANDDIANAIEITELLPFMTVQNTGGATLENEEPLPSCAPDVTSSVWYLFVPSIDYHNMTFSTTGSGYDTVLSIWQGSESPLTELACNDDATATEQSYSSQLTIPLTSNLTYYIDISGVDDEAGQLILQVEEGQTDFQLATQPPAPTVGKCQPAQLTIDLENLQGERIVAGGTLGNQWETGVALPFTYQWYQGNRGDLDTPVGTDSYRLITPLLTTSTPYWVRITNPTGTLDSDTLTVTVVEHEVPNGTGVDAVGLLLSTGAHFVGWVTTSAEEIENVIAINQTDTVQVHFAVAVDIHHLEQLADILIVGGYTVDEQTYYFMRNGNLWELWEGNLAELAAASEQVLLSDCLEVPVFEGRLENLPGQFSVYVGYRLNPGDIYFNSEPITFTVE